MGYGEVPERGFENQIAQNYLLGKIQKSKEKIKPILSQRYVSKLSGVRSDLYIWVVRDAHFRSFMEEDVNFCI